MNHNKKRKNKKEVLDEQKIIDKKEIGKLFKKFRKAINKAQHELGSESNVVQSFISNIETGRCYPNLKFLVYLYEKYRLNIRWLLSGKGEMFVIKDVRKEGQISATDQGYIDLLKMMKVPVIELQIFAKLAETKITLKDNIKNYKSNEKNKHAI